MKNIARTLISSIFLLPASVCLAQTPVLVTANIVGTNSAPYAYGTYQVQLVDSSGNPLSNTTPSQNQFSGLLTPSGSLAVTLYPNSVFLLPLGVTSTQWKFSICSALPGASNPIKETVQTCYSVSTTIAVAGDLSATLSAAAPAVYYFNSKTGILYGALGQAGTALPAGTTATTSASSGDASNLVATNAQVQNAINFSQSRFGLNIAGGTYSFDSQGTGAQVVIFVSGGSVSSVIAAANPGSGYAVGDLLFVTPGGAVGGNGDAVIRVTAVSGTGFSTGSVVSGGTGYTATGLGSTVSAAVGRPFTFVLTGTLTGNVQFIMKFGTYLTTSNQWIFANNTTGAFSVNVCEGNASDVCTGGSTITLNQGVANSSSVLIETDGVLNMFLVNQGAIPVHGALTLTAATSDVLTLQGVLPTSICTFSPANALAAAATVVPYVSAVAANSVTIAHVVTTANGGIENVICSTY